MASPVSSDPLGGERFEAFSAGTEATRVRPLAIRAMQELGIDISAQESKTLERYLDQPFDAVVTVCDQANEACPVFFGARERLNWSFPDPSKATGSEDEQLSVYRHVRDAIRERIERDLLAGRNAPYEAAHRLAKPTFPETGALASRARRWVQRHPSS